MINLKTDMSVFYLIGPQKSIEKLVRYPNLGDGLSTTLSNGAGPM
jgi:hypothetical protein